MIHPRVLAKRVLAVPTIALHAGRSRPRRWILTFHDVGPVPPAIPADRFGAILDRLAREVDLVPLHELLARDVRGRARAAITFDDGYAGMADRALPLLRRAGVVPTVFVPTALLGEEDAVPPEGSRLYPGAALLGWRRLRDLVSAGTLDAGSHGATHRALPALSPSDRRDEVRRSRAALESRLLRPCPYLAYPFGLHDTATAREVAEAGYRAAFTSRHGPLRAQESPFRLPRMDVRAEYEPGDVLAALRGDFDYLSWIHRRREGAADTALGPS